MKLVLATLLILSSFPLFAGGKEELEVELRKTDRWIDRASEVLRKAEVASFSRAEGVLEMARELQHKAKTRRSMRHYKDALKLTQTARQAAKKAIEIAFGFELTPSNIEYALSRTDELISKAGALIQQVDNQKVSELYRVALNAQQSARESHRNHRLLISLKLTLSARRMIMRLMRMTKEIGSDKVERELDITDRLISRIGDDGKEFEQAKDMQRNAYAHFHSSRYIQAYRLTKQAQKIIYSILKEVEDINPDEVKKAIAETEHLLNLADIDSHTRQRLNQMISEAKDEVKAERYQQALIKISAAKRLLDKTIGE